LPILVTDDVDQAIHCVNALAANGSQVEIHCVHRMQ
jgi:2-keto-3-deoxy-6-phosphogluconate aldolase